MSEGDGKPKSKDDQGKILRQYPTLIGAALGGFVVLAAVYIFNFRNHPFSGSSADWGALGDFFGGMLNPLLSFLALIAILQTIKLQQQSLETTRQELKLSTEELRGSRKALEEQKKSLDDQRFESAFFKRAELLFSERNSLLKNANKSQFDYQIQCGEGENLEKIVLGSAYSKPSGREKFKEDTALPADAYRVVNEHFTKINAERILSYSSVQRQIIGTLSFACQSRDPKTYIDIVLSVLTVPEIAFVCAMIQALDPRTMSYIYQSDVISSINLVKLSDYTDRRYLRGLQEAIHSTR
ncbi:hypothetical protein [Parvularcula sp. LCG005]|uniref:hypothetical protein n=1 Tax=Parvularcula sp. LCG005 TaxID=3078805 RepID=UPI00294293D5|nr:hypothetical protein [Parvularcula sp. LCG005]WOI54196.1 hypothetical protein RUI03_04160 [Parvularcula sp. LCG005]